MENIDQMTRRLIPFWNIPIATNVNNKIPGKQNTKQQEFHVVNTWKKHNEFHFGMKKYARRYLSYLPTSYVLAKRVEYIKDTFGRVRHWKLARRAGRTSCTLCSLVSRLHA